METSDSSRKSKSGSDDEFTIMIDHLDFPFSLSKSWENPGITSMMPWLSM